MYHVHTVTGFQAGSGVVSPIPYLDAEDGGLLGLLVLGGGPPVSGLLGSAQREPVDETQHSRLPAAAERVEGHHAPIKTTGGLALVFQLSAVFVLFV